MNASSHPSLVTTTNADPSHIAAASDLVLFANSPSHVSQCISPSVSSALNQSLLLAPRAIRGAPPFVPSIDLATFQRDQSVSSMLHPSSASSSRSMFGPSPAALPFISNVPGLGNLAQTGSPVGGLPVSSHAQSDILHRPLSGGSGQLLALPSSPNLLMLPSSGTASEQSSSYDHKPLIDVVPNYSFRSENGNIVRQTNHLGIPI